MQSGTPAHEMVCPAFRSGLPISVNRIYRLPNRDVQGLVSCDSVVYQVNNTNYHSMYILKKYAPHLGSTNIITVLTFTDEEELRLGPAFKVKLDTTSPGIGGLLFASRLIFLILSYHLCTLGAGIGNIGK